MNSEEDFLFYMALNNKQILVVSLPNAPGNFSVKTAENVQNR